MQSFVFRLFVLSAVTFGAAAQLSPPATAQSLDSPNASERVAAVGKLADQTALARVAVEDKSWAVRKAAVDKLQDQALLAKIITDDKDSEVRVAAVKKLTDQAMLAKIAIEGKDKDIQDAAVATLTDQSLLAKVVLEGNFSQQPSGLLAEGIVEKLTDQSLLAKIAVEDKSSHEREIAVKKLTGQTLLAKIAVEDKAEDVRGDAFDRLTDKSLLANLVTDTRVPPRARHMAIGRLKEWNVDYRKLAGNLTLSTNDALEALGRMHLALVSPVISRRMPNIDLDASVAPQFQLYGCGGCASMPGEDVGFTLKRRSDVLIEGHWRTVFPQYAGAMNFLPAKVNISTMLAKLLSNFPQDEIVTLSGAEVPEVRAAAVASLQDQTLLAKMATGDTDYLVVRPAAIRKLTDQALLADIASSKDNRREDHTVVRVAAVATLTDQPLLAKLAMDLHNAGDVQVAAIKKLSDQALLAEIALRDDGQTMSLDNGTLDRTTRGIPAVEALTDQAMLAKVALEGKAGEIRAAATEKLTDQSVLAEIVSKNEHEAQYVKKAAIKKLTDKTVLANIAVEDKDSFVRDAAKQRLKELGADKP